MKIITALLIVYLPLFLAGQEITETRYFDEDWNKTDSSLAVYVKHYIYRDSTKNSGTIKVSTISGKPKWEDEYSDIEKGVHDGVSKKYHDNGVLKVVETYTDNKLHGEVRTYYATGQLRRKDYFENGKFAEGNCYTASGLDTAHFDYFVNPEFPGGMNEMFKYISKNVVYPKEAIEQDITGRVIVKFVIEKSGSITNKEIVKSVHPLLDEEAVRVIGEMGKWNPGLRDAEPVRVAVTIPIFFRLEGPTPKKKKKKR